MQNLIDVLKIAVGTFFGLVVFAGVINTFIQVRMVKARQSAEAQADAAIAQFMEQNGARIAQELAQNGKTQNPTVGQEAEQVQKNG